MPWPCCLFAAIEALTKTQLGKNKTSTLGELYFRYKINIPEKECHRSLCRAIETTQGNLCWEIVLQVREDEKARQIPPAKPCVDRKPLGREQRKKEDLELGGSQEPLEAWPLLLIPLVYPLPRGRQDLPIPNLLLFRDVRNKGIILLYQ